MKTMTQHLETISIRMSSGDVSGHHQKLKYRVQDNNLDCVLREGFRPREWKKIPRFRGRRLLSAE